MWPGNFCSQKKYCVHIPKHWHPDGVSVSATCMLLQIQIQNQNTQGGFCQNQIRAKTRREIQHQNPEKCPVLISSYDHVWNLYFVKLIPHKESIKNHRITCPLLLRGSELRKHSHWDFSSCTAARKKQIDKTNMKEKLLMSFVHTDITTVLILVFENVSSSLCQLERICQTSCISVSPPGSFCGWCQPLWMEWDAWCLLPPRYWDGCWKVQITGRLESNMKADILSILHVVSLLWVIIGCVWSSDKPIPPLRP